MMVELHIRIATLSFEPVSKIVQHQNLISYNILHLQNPCMPGQSGSRITTVQIQNSHHFKNGLQQQTKAMHVRVDTYKNKHDDLIFTLKLGLVLGVEPAYDFLH